MTAYKGLGTYGNAVGVVTPTDHKGVQAGQVVKASANLIRPGLFWGGTATIITGKANMSYDVAAYTCVTTRGASFGAVFGGNNGVLNVVTTAAPGSNSRIDIIYHWHREYSLDGVDSNPVIGVIQGTAAAVPVAPSLSAFPGAIEIGRATVGAGITATTSATITQTAPFTAMAGGTVQVRTTTERDAGTWIAGQRIRLLDTLIEQTYNGTTWGAGDVLPTYSGRLTSPVSLVNNAVTVLPDFTDIQKTGGFTEVSGVVTLPLTGQYVVDVSPYAATAGATHFVSLLLNGATSAERIAGAEGGSALNISICRKFTAGDTIRVQSYQNSGSTKTLSDMGGGATLPFLNIRYIGQV